MMLISLVSQAYTVFALTPIVCAGDAVGTEPTRVRVAGCPYPDPAKPVMMAKYVKTRNEGAISPYFPPVDEICILPSRIVPDQSPARGTLPRREVHCKYFGGGQKPLFCAGPPVRPVGAIRIQQKSEGR